MIFISHRGESKDAPENTLPAFELSQKRAVSGMECDIHLTRDRVLVTIHDSDTGRVGGRGMIVEESTFAELQTLDVSNHKPGFRNTRIPKFSETLRYLGPGRLFYVEIKGDDPAVIDAMISELDAAKIPPEQIVMISFSESVVRLFKERFPRRKALLLTGCRAQSNGTWGPTADQLIAKLESLGADGVDINGNLSFITAEYVRKVKAAGFTFAVWTVDDEAQARPLIGFGVDAVTSNRAAALQEFFGRA